MEVLGIHLYFSIVIQKVDWFVPSGPSTAIQIDGASKMIWSDDHNTSIVPTQFINGSASSPSVAFTSGTNSGLYYSTGSSVLV